MTSYPFRRTCLVAVALVIGVGWPQFGSAQSGARIETTISALSTPFSGDLVGGFAYDGSTHRLYAQQIGSANVRVIDLNSGLLVDTLSLSGWEGSNWYGAGDRLFALDTVRQRIYAGENTSSSKGVFVYDTQTTAQIDNWPGAGFSEPGFLALNPANGLLYQYGSGVLTVFDPTKPLGALRFFMYGPVDSGQGQTGLTVNPSTNIVYIAATNFIDLSLRVVAVDGRTGSSSFHTILSELTTSLPSGRHSDWRTPRIAVDRARNRVFVGDGQTVWTIDGTPGSPTFNQAIATTVVTTDPQLWVDDLAVNPITSRVYVKLSTGSPLFRGVTGAGRLVTLDANSHVVIGVMNLPGRHFGGWVVVDPARERVFVAPGWFGALMNDGIEDPNLESEILVISDPTTTTVPVSADSVTETPQATMQFSQVSSPGNVTVERIEQSELPAPLPGQFTIDGGLAYNITTTATVQGPIAICFNASHVADPTTFAALRVLHGENGTWVDRTISRDFATGSICAQTSSLSPFVVATLDVDYQVRELYDATRAVKAGGTVPLKIQLIAPWGANLSASDITVTATSLQKLSDTASFVVQDAGQSNADNNFRFDATVGSGGGYVFNLQTKGLTTGTYELEFTATGDRTIHKLRFQVR